MTLRRLVVVHGCVRFVSRHVVRRRSSGIGETDRGRAAASQFRQAQQAQQASHNHARRQTQRIPLRHVFESSSRWDHITSSLPNFCPRTEGSQRGGQRRTPKQRQMDESSQVLNALVRAAAKVERWYDWARTSHVGRIVHPQQSNNIWGPPLDMSTNVTDSVLRDVHATAQLHTRPGSLLSEERELSRITKGAAQRVHHLPNRSERGISVTEVHIEQPEEDESAWRMIHNLLTSRKYLTTQQQATVQLYRDQPDFNESTFLSDVQLKLLPDFLNAYWAQDTERLKAICSPACYHTEVAPLLTQYALLQSRCRLLMVYDAVIFNRLMMVDDSEFNTCEATTGPKPVLFVAVTAQLIDCWVRSSVPTKARRMLPSDFALIERGDPYLSEDYVFVLGLVPEPRNRWVLTSFRHCRADALE